MDLGYYYRIIIKELDLSFDDFAISIIGPYVQRIKNMQTSAKLIVCGINLPTLFSKKEAVTYTSRIIYENSAKSHVQIEEAEREFFRKIPSIEKRTQNTLLFNKLLQRECEKHTIEYFDYTDHFLSTKTKLLKEKYKRTDDQHYSLSNKDSEFVINSVVNLFKSCNPEI